MKVASPCILLNAALARVKFDISSRSGVVQWVSWRRMIWASCLVANWLKTQILLAVIPSMFSCRMFGLQISSDLFWFLGRRVYPFTTPGWSPNISLANVKFFQFPENATRRLLT